MKRQLLGKGDDTNKSLEILSVASASKQLFLLKYSNMQ